MKPFRPEISVVLLIIGAFLSPGSAEEKTYISSPSIKMRDGVELATDLYFPEGKGPWPCVLARTPYNKNGVRFVAYGFTSRGFVLAAQDCRGKFKSKGKYDPFKKDHQDGFDTIEWIANQKWSDGKVGMWGASALGITTNLASTQKPKALKCAYVIVASASARHQTVYMGGVYRKELNDGWLTAQGAIHTIEETIRNPAGNEFWNWREIADFYSEIDIPVYNVGGWFDIFSQGTLDNFAGLHTKGKGLARGNQKLWIGPYAHGPMGGRLKFPDGDAGQALDMKRVYRWFSRWLKDEKNGIDEEPPVNYYLMGDTEDKNAPGNHWVKAGSWPPASRPTSYFLDHDGSIQRELPGKSNKLTYAYDPKNPVPTIGGGNLILGGKGPMDQRKIQDRKDYLRFQSEVLKEPVAIAGRVTADLFISSDAPDTDFAVKLVDVYPDGYEALILDGILRTRYRKGLKEPVMLSPGKVEPITVDLWSTALVFNKGHRIAVHITSSNDPRFDPNPNTGDPLRANKKTRIANNSVHFGGVEASRIVLPVIETPKKAKQPSELKNEEKDSDDAKE